MRKLLTVLMASAIAAITIGQNLTIKVNDDVLSTGDAPALIHKGRVLVPVRSIFEKLGATVLWEPNIATVTITRGDLIAKLFTGSQKLEVNGEERIMDIEPQHLNGVMRIPLRVVSELLGAKVHWDAPARTVLIWTTPANPFL